MGLFHYDEIFVGYNISAKFVEIEKFSQNSKFNFEIPRRHWSIKIFQSRRIPLIILVMGYRYGTYTGDLEGETAPPPQKKNLFNFNFFIAEDLAISQSKYQTLS